MLKIGVIGSGARAAWVVRCMCLIDPELRLGIVADPTPALARKRLTDAGVEHGDTRFVASVNELIERADELAGIVIGTRCNLHAPLAIAIAQTGLPLFLEKPVAITAQQLEALHEAYAGREQSVVVSFPLRLTPLFRRALDVVRSGRLGTINQVQAFNYVPYGGVYFAQWYRDYESNGGLWLQKATHDVDCINQLVGAAPRSVVALSTRKIYGGQMPDGLMCSACDRAAECPESPASIAARDDDGGMGREDHACAFSESIRHHDAGSALILYADGTHAAYSQNFVSRRSAAARGARITGYLATLKLDFYTDSMQIIEHHGTAVESVTVPTAEAHSGGDAGLARNFVDLMRGADTSQSDLRDGIRSVAVCLAARTSETTARVEPVTVPGESNDSQLVQASPQTPPRVTVTIAAGAQRESLAGNGDGHGKNFVPHDVD